MDYTSFIEKTKLIETYESTTTTGGIEYDGSALEICDEKGEELFHIVVDKKGERQILFFAAKEAYRLPLESMEEIIAQARKFVRKIE